ncbi:MAG: hypothetical protein AAFY97_05220, partial [Pseudomonadota bacterium]
MDIHLVVGRNADRRFEFPRQICLAQDELHAEAYEWSKRISEHLLPNTKAYAEIWLDGEKQKTTEEPILGETYLPR